MPQQLKYVAQLAMDNFYQQYKGENDFWDLDQFIDMAGNIVAGMYLAFYQQEYAMLRQERKNDAETISFDSGWLVEQDLEVKNDGGILSAAISKPVMTFPYDRSSIGVQEVFILDPGGSQEPERTTLAALYQLKYLPKTNRVFFYQNLTTIKFWSNIIFNVKKIRLLYVPVMSDGESPVADGIISDVITKTVLAMKQMANGNVIDSTENQNNNKIMQTEIDKATLVK